MAYVAYDAPASFYVLITWHCLTEIIAIDQLTISNLTEIVQKLYKICFFSVMFTCWNGPGQARMNPISLLTSARIYSDFFFQENNASTIVWLLCIHSCTTTFSSWKVELALGYSRHVLPMSSDLRKGWVFSSAKKIITTKSSQHH